ncbi:unnamed protein product [Arabidopsis thaliana]|uniref:(thale cress) hypothetical protein n=1 Tax=Arabidopsis thaliana TaxID=3702 RepID=A0A7G2EQX6_ARATH|nr:unnamed protein product [Arabidopsis thaliana]
MFQVDREASPSFPVSILESFPIASQRMASLDDVESKTGVEGVRMMESPVIEIEEEEVELIQAPVPHFFMDDYVLIESELAQAGTRWEDYVVLPNSPVSTLVGAETAFNLVSSACAWFCIHIYNMQRCSISYLYTESINRLYIHKS